ncbi:hypothetical protein [Synechococcus sp. GEYO]|uniref:hypothetical protein n=1 Tax=Synechococcus sp. GEYO TaxID=2575511 RepID=UPI000E0F6366|nr:hypothetical protein [Synechococcus sp. GEYO]
MNSSLCFDPGSLDQEVAGGKTSPVNKKARVSAPALRKMVLQGGKYADRSNDWNVDVLGITKEKLQTGQKS